MKKLIAGILLILSQVVAPSQAVVTCTTCGHEHPYVERGTVVETYGEGNAVAFENQLGEIVEWYISDEPTSVQVGDSMTVVGCEIIEINGQRY